jgi:SSS family solute:Na+ symporter
MAQTLSTIDYVILIVYLVATLALGLYIGRGIRTGKDFFLGGRRLPWWAIGMSLVATDIGGTDIIGVGGAAYSHGFAVANFEWIGCVPAMIVASFVFVPYFYRTGIYTIPEFMERRYNPAVRVALAACWLAFMACNLGIMLLASAKMTVLLFQWNEFVTLTKIAESLGLENTNLFVRLVSLLLSPEAISILMTAALVGIYTCAGGLAAVVYTDMIQCSVMIVGCLLVLCISLWDIGGIGKLNAELKRIDREKSQAVNVAEQEDNNASPVDRASLIQPVDTKTPFPWTGIFFGLALILSPAYWIGNQAIVQRTLGAKNEFHAKAAYIWGALLKNLIPFIIAVPGLIALVKFPELKEGDQAFPQLVATLLPTGLRGVFLAAFLAALMSSIDSYLNSASTIVTHDLYKRFLNKDANETRLLRIGRLVTLGLVAWAIVFALLFVNQKEEIYSIFQTLMAFFQGPALAILLTGLFWKRANGTGALTGFITGVLVSISLFLLNTITVTRLLGLKPLFRIEDPFLYLSVWAFLVSLTIVIVVSLLTKPEPDEKIKHLIYHRHTRTEA